MQIFSALLVLYDNKLNIDFGKNNLNMYIMVLGNAVCTLSITSCSLNDCP